jgi:predicted DNA-binding transcriptional regulator YafY
MLYSEPGLCLSDRIAVFREQFKSIKDLKHTGRIEGPISPAVKKAIINAITYKYQISIYYLGDKSNSAGWRTVQPYVYGRVKGTANQVLRAYQIDGPSYSGHFPKWRLFRLDRIFNITSNTTQTFTKAKPLYNFFWDRGMILRYVWAKFPKVP